MATYVNNLRLKEIATGAESGTWGTSTNTNLELIADALGSGTEAITTNADTHTTTIADGAADEGRALFLKYTGTLDSACTITLAPNTVNKVWFIENATSGSQDIIISQGSGANITIANGKIAVILTDGAGGGAAVLDALADLELSSTLSVAGASTLTGNVTVGGTLGCGAITATGALTTIFQAVNDGNPALKLGSSAAECLVIQPVYDSGAQTLNYIAIDTAAASATANKGEIRFTVDGDASGTSTVKFQDAGVDIAGTLDVTGTSTLGDDLTFDGTTVSVATGDPWQFKIAAHTEPSAGAEVLFFQTKNASNASTDRLTIEGGHDTGEVHIKNADLAVAGDLAVTGALSKGSGSFKIHHPLPAKKDTHHLVHSFIEGPRADLVYRGVTTLSGGAATVDIDAAAGMTAGTFELLCRDVQCFTANETDWTAVRGSLSGSVLTIEAEDASSTAAISWMVVGERKDAHIMETRWTDDEGRVIVEPEKEAT